MTQYQEILAKIDGGIKLDEDELQSLVWDLEVEKSYGENRRWSRTVSTIISLENRFFQIDWENGLTESQENEFYSQPFEVEKHEYEKTITVKEWKRK